MHALRIALIVIVAACVPQSWAQDAKPVKLRAGVGSLGFPYAPVHVAMAKGYFADEKIEVTLEVISAGAGAVVTALLGNNIDLGLPGTNGGILAAAKGQPVVTIGSIATGALSTLVFSKAYAEKHGIRADSPMEQKVAALKGARITSVAPGSFTQVVIEAFLKARGMDPVKDVSLVPIRDQGGMLAALRTGQSDVLIFGPPTPNSAVADGYGVMGFNLADDPSLRDVSWTAVVVSRKWLASNGDVATRFLRALWRADQLIHSNEPEARAAARTAFKNMSDALFYEAWRASLSSFPASPVITPSQVSAVVKLINATVTPPIAPKFADVADNRYAEMAKPK